MEDDPHLADVLGRGLGRDGHTADICANGDDALVQAELRSYDALILDIMLPGVSGIEICRRRRARGSTVPIVLLTARDTVDDIVDGLEAGADDYVTKPFEFRELRARLHSVVRRSAGAATSQLRANDLTLDIDAREARVAGTPIALTAREYQVLECLMVNRGHVLSRSVLEEHVWGYDYDGISNTVDVHIRRLRSKLDRPGMPSVIETVRGSGYRIRKDHPAGRAI